MLEVDGVVLAQSLAIARFLSRRYGLGGKDQVEQARVDMVVEAVADVRSSK